MKKLFKKIIFFRFNYFEKIRKHFLYLECLIVTLSTIIMIREKNYFSYHAVNFPFSGSGKISYALLQNHILPDPSLLQCLFKKGNQYYQLNKLIHQQNKGMFYV